MIREPRVGMEVKVTARKSNNYGCVGKVVKLDDDSVPVLVEFSDGNDWWYKKESLTEIKENDMGEIKCGDCKFWDKDNTVNVKAESLEIIKVAKCLSHSAGRILVSAYVKHDCDDYESHVKEVTMADLEEKYGCKVKVVK